VIFKQNDLASQQKKDITKSLHKLLNNKRTKMNIKINEKAIEGYPFYKITRRTTQNFNEFIPPKPSNHVYVLLRKEFVSIISMSTIVSSDTTFPRKPCCSLEGAIVGLELIGLMSSGSCNSWRSSSLLHSSLLVSSSIVDMA